jgi:two-component system, response regulator, stage 0 sporulation protein F
MPEMNGIQFIKRAKTDYQHIKYFILSGYELTKEIVDALNNHLIFKYFRKPFNPKEIEEAIKKVLEL